MRTKSKPGWVINAEDYARIFGKDPQEVIEEFREKRRAAGIDDEAPQVRMSHQQRKDEGYICPIELRYEILYRSRGACYVCGVPEWETKRSLHIHRVQPNSKGGRYVDGNVIPVCVSCHAKVEGKSWTEINVIANRPALERWVGR